MIEIDVAVKRIERAVLMLAKKLDTSSFEVVHVASKKIDIECDGVLNPEAYDLLMTHFGNIIIGLCHTGTLLEDSCFVNAYSYLLATVVDMDLDDFSKHFQAMDRQYGIVAEQVRYFMPKFAKSNKASLIGTLSSCFSIDETGRIHYDVEMFRQSVSNNLCAVISILTIFIIAHGLNEQLIIGSIPKEVKIRL